MTNALPGCLLVAALLPSCGDAPDPADRREERDPRRTGGSSASLVAPVPTIRPGFDGFLYMPWRYQWEIGTGDAGGQLCRDLGINGGFLDRGEGPLDWLEQWGLHFYVDHVAGKGILHLRPAPEDGPVRSPPLDDATRQQALDRIRQSLARVRGSALRFAYALDDEPSWGRFVRPLTWRVRNQADDDSFREPHQLFEQLDGPLNRIDLSPLLDRLSENDGIWTAFVRDLVAEANRIDPRTPCGLVGLQAPSAFGGYDYARLTPCLQFAEVYDQGSAPEIVRSLGRQQGITLVSTHFHRDRPGADSWFAWSRFAHGQRGLIGWVEGWFDGNQPAAWLRGFGATLRELCGSQGGKLADTRFEHDGIALYYSQPSIQVSWCLDAQPHGKTWRNRNDDHLLGTSHLVRKAWELLLNDSGLQYDFVSSLQVAERGVPAEYEVLILPACLALGDAEARRIEEFVESGGRVVADFMCGLFDERGRGRERGALDRLFGVQHQGSDTAADYFAERLWVETDQEEGYDSVRFAELFASLDVPLHAGYARPRPELAAANGRGEARYLNLSPQRYLAERETGPVARPRRAPFIEPLGVRPFVQARAEIPLEVTRFVGDRRRYLFVFENPLFGRDGSPRTDVGPVEVELLFTEPALNLRDERSGRSLGSGREFRLTLERSEALFLSMAVGEDG